VARGAERSASRRPSPRRRAQPGRGGRRARLAAEIACENLDVRELKNVDAPIRFSLRA